MLARVGLYVIPGKIIKLWFCSLVRTRGISDQLKTRQIANQSAIVEPRTNLRKVTLLSLQVKFHQPRPSHVTFPSIFGTITQPSTWSQTHKKASLSSRRLIPVLSFIWLFNSRKVSRRQKLCFVVNTSTKKTVRQPPRIGSRRSGSVPINDSS